MNNHFHYYINVFREMDLVIFLISLSSVLKGGGYNLVQPSYNNQYFHNSFTYKITHIWNKLPSYIKQSPNLNAFHKNLESINLIRTTCLCYCQS